MRQTLKRVLAVFLCLVLLGGAAPAAGIAQWAGGLTASAASKKITDYSVGDLVQFGSYPQSRVTDATIITKLDNVAASKAWTSYNYYSGTGDYDDYQIKTNPDMMRYVDISVDGAEYRGVKIDAYRPYWTGDTSTASHTNQDENGYTLGNTIYWFRFETIWWRVLDPEIGLILCESIIDSQAYNIYCLPSNTGAYGYFGNPEKTYYANNYAHSSIRQWLNADFYRTAFSAAQQEIIQTTALDNKAYSSSFSDYSEYDAESTNDRIFLLSYSDVLNTQYGFFSSCYTDDIARLAQGSDYAKCQGLWVSSSGNSIWHLRSAGGDSDHTCRVFHDGSVGYNYGVDYTEFGVRPALRLHLTSDIFQSDDSIFSGSSTVYNHELARFCADFSMYGYSMGGIDGKLRDAGFTLVKKDGSADRDEVNYFIASKDEVQNGVQKKIVFVGCIGSYKKQWYSNFDPAATQRDTKADRGGAPFASNSSTLHLGFADAMEYVYYNLSIYIKSLQAAGGRPEDIKVFLTGHSRGAATVNLLAARLVDEQDSPSALAKSGNIYAYTFATPRPTTAQNSTKYDCIFNIVNPEDFVTKVMLEGWYYRRYGRTYTLPSQTNDKNWKSYLASMRVFFKEYTGYTYEPYSKGEKATYKIVQKMTKEISTSNGLYTDKFNATWDIDWGWQFASKWTPFEFFKNTLLPFVAKESVDWGKIAGVILGPGTLYRSILWYFASPDLDLPKNISKEELINTLKRTFGNQFAEAHQMETYRAYMHALTEDQLKETRKGHQGTVNCPVDVEVYDNETHTLVGRIVNNVVDSEIAGGEHSVVMSVDGDSKEFWLPGNGDYTVKLIGNDDGTMDYTIAEIDSADSVEVERSNFFDVEITKGKVMTAEFPAEQTDIENAELTLENGTVLTPTETTSEDAQTLCTVEVVTDGDGVAESVCGYSGDYVTVKAVPIEGAEFIGWYKDGQPLSTETEYSFVLKNDLSLTAVFTKRIVRSIALADAVVQYKSALTLTPAIEADQGTNYTVVFTSSNPKIAEVDKDGKITTHKKGTVTITCTVTNNDDPTNKVETTCKVTVKYAWWQWLIRILLLGFLWY